MKLFNISLACKQLWASELVKVTKGPGWLKHSTMAMPWSTGAGLASMTSTGLPVTQKTQVSKKASAAKPASTCKCHHFWDGMWEETAHWKFGVYFAENSQADARCDSSCPAETTSKTAEFVQALSIYFWMLPLLVLVNGEAQGGLGCTKAHGVKAFLL